MKQIELHIKDKTTQSGVIPIHWCVSQDIINFIKEVGLKPYLVLVTKPKDDVYSATEVRKIVPLSDLMAYIEFSKPGENYILGFITWSKSGILTKYHDGYESLLFYTNSELRSMLGFETNKDEYKPFVGEKREYALEELLLTEEELKNDSPILNKWFKKRDAHLLATTMLEKQGINSNDFENYSDFVLHRNDFESKIIQRLGKRWDILQVNVPEEVFGKKPAEWELKWINRWYPNDKINDQCGLRRRRLFAYTIQPPLVLIYKVFSAIANLIVFLAGWKITSFWNFFDVADNLNSLESYKFSDGENNRWLTPLWLNIFNPLLLTVLTVFGYYNNFVFLAVVVIPGIAVALLAAAIIDFILSTVLDKFKKEEPKIEDEVDLLLCNQQRYFKPSDLPKNKKSIKLRFSGLKAKVCRPLAK